jgi:regulator of protease activity HflC (stomatin/prohibitin superfamily)
MKAYLWSVDEPPPTTRRQRWRQFIERHLPAVVIYLMVATLVAVVLYPRVVVTIPSGHVGVLWKRFAGGTVLDPRELKDEGLHLILPWDRVFQYDLRVQSIAETYNAISSDGVSMTVGINIRFRLKHDSIPTLHQVIGPNYIKLIGPQIASQMREVIAQYTAEQVYSTARHEIQNKISERTVERLGEKMMEREAEAVASYSVAMRDTITLYDTLLYGIDLPADVVAAINRKAEQYYIAEEYKFRVERERRESDRKKIEAEGIREFQRIVSQGISDSYLRWRGIEATLQLAQSSNSKVVIIGSGKDGLPIILGNVDAPAHAAGAPPAEGGTIPRPPNTGAGPAVSLEKTPASGLTMPSSAPAGLAKPADIAPGAGSRPAFETSSATGPGTQSAAAPEQRHSLIPLSLADLETLLYRVIGATGSEKGPVPRQPFEQAQTRNQPFEQAPTRNQPFEQMRTRNQPFEQVPTTNQPFERPSPQQPR